MTGTFLSRTRGVRTGFSGKVAFPLALTAALLTGCAGSTVSGQWDCPAQEGMACTSIGEADHHVGGEHSHEHVRVTPKGIASGSTTGAETPGVTDTSISDTRITDTHVRSSEVTARIWIYPFVDKADVYHEGGYVHALIAPADWQTSPDHLFPAGITAGQTLSQTELSQASPQVAEPSGIEPPFIPILRSEPEQTDTAREADPSETSQDETSLDASTPASVSSDPLPLQNDPSPEEQR